MWVMIKIVNKPQVTVNCQIFKGFSLFFSLTGPFLHVICHYSALEVCLVYRKYHKHLDFYFLFIFIKLFKNCQKKIKWKKCKQNEKT